MVHRVSCQTYCFLSLQTHPSKGFLKTSLHKEGESEFGIPSPGSLRWIVYLHYLMVPSPGSLRQIVYLHYLMVPSPGSQRRIVYLHYLMVLGILLSSF